MRMTLCDVIDEWPLCENAHVLSAWYSDMSIRPCVGRGRNFYYVLKCQGGVKGPVPGLNTPYTYERCRQVL